MSRNGLTSYMTFRTKVCVGFYFERVQWYYLQYYKHSKRKEISWVTTNLLDDKGLLLEEMF